MSDALTERIRTVAKTISHSQGNFILKEAEVCDAACMVASGLVRSFYVNEGEEITSSFNVRVFA
jgi:hypothetical protein